MPRNNDGRANNDDDGCGYVVSLELHVLRRVFDCSMHPDVSKFGDDNLFG